MLVICSPRSNRDFKALHEVIQYLPSSSPRIRVAVAPGEAALFAKEGIERKEEVIVVIGGDMTISEILPIMLFEETKLAIVPIGRENGIARHLKVPTRPRLAIKAIIESQYKGVDVMKVREKYFLKNFELGSVVSENGSNTVRPFDEIAKRFSFESFLFSLYEDGKEIHEGEIFRFEMISRMFDGLEIGLSSSRMESLGFRARNHRMGKGRISFFNDRDLVAAVDGRAFLLPKGNHEVETMPKAIRLIQVS